MLSAKLTSAYTHYTKVFEKALMYHSVNLLKLIDSINQPLKLGDGYIFLLAFSREYGDTALVSSQH